MSKAECLWISRVNCNWEKLYVFCFSNLELSGTFKINHNTFWILIIVNSPQKMSSWKSSFCQEKCTFAVCQISKHFFLTDKLKSKQVVLNKQITDKESHGKPEWDIFKHIWLLKLHVVYLQTCLSLSIETQMCPTYSWTVEFWIK